MTRVYAAGVVSMVVLMCAMGMAQGLVVPSARSASDPEPPFHFTTHAFEQRLDHFDMYNATTFSQRYLMNDTWFKPGGPIFFYTGNEGPIELFAQNTGFMWDIAPKFGALLLFGEHRYFGHSLPFGNATYEDPITSGNLRYLSAEQALADYAHMLLTLKAEKGWQDSPIIAFGGSYGGMLSSWFRIKYPWVAQGAIAASAPILQFTNMTAPQLYNAVITNTFHNASPVCSESIAKSWDIIRSTSPEDLTSIFTPCKPFDATTDVNLLFNWINGAIAYMTMADYPYPASFLGPMPGWPVNVACTYFSQEHQDDASILRGVRGLANLFYNYTGEAGQCFDMAMAGPSTLGSEAGWAYLACTEMVMPVGQYGPPNDMFYPAPWNLDAYLKTCQEQYGLMPRADWVATVYGGKDLSAASNIVFSNGRLDPWSSGGVHFNASSTVFAIWIEDGAHHLDLRAANRLDPHSVIVARDFHQQNIAGWIKEFHMQQQKQQQQQQAKNEL